MTNPPEIVLDARTPTQRLEDDIVKACRTIRDQWPRMIRHGETQAPGRINPSGVTLDDHDPRESDTRRIDRAMSHRRFTMDVLNQWSRLIMDDRNITNPKSLPLGTDVPGMCSFIDRNAQWLSGHEAADDARRELKALAKAGEPFDLPPISDKPLPPKPHFIGRCPQEWEFDPEEGMKVCGGKVYAEQETISDLTISEQRAAKQPTCRRCGTEADVDWWYRLMFPDAGTSHLVTVDELIGVIAVRLDWVVTHGQVRIWKHRGKIESAGKDAKGRTLYRHDDVIEAVRDDVQIQREKVAR